MKFAVPVVFRGQHNYIIDADTPEAAQKMAEEAFKSDVAPDVLGNEWEEEERVGTPTPIDAPTDS